MENKDDEIIIRRENIKPFVVDKMSDEELIDWYDDSYHQWLKEVVSRSRQNHNS